MNKAGEVEAVAVFFRDVTRKKLEKDRLEFLVASSKILSITGDLQVRLLEKSRLLIPSLADWCTINIVNEDGSLTRVAVSHRDPNKKALVEALSEYVENPVETSSIHRVIRTGKSELYPRVDIGQVYKNYPNKNIRPLLEELRPTSAMIVPIVSRGKVLGVLSLVYSDSERVYSEEDLEFMEEFGFHLGVAVENARLYAEIEKRDKAKDRFLATLSHELRNPLAPIKHSLDALSLTITDTAAEEELTTIVHQFDHLTKLLQDLLDITRYTQAKIRIEKKPVELQALIKAAISAQKPFIREKGVDFIANLPPKPLWISADPLRIEQALINLLHNAEKFTPPGGAITLTLTSQNDEVCIEIRDNGMGIEKEELSEVFELYFQGTHQGNERVGLGIGLQLVREIVRAHGGTIQVASEGAGTGSTFSIALPLLAMDGAELSGGTTRVPKTTVHKKILVIDDNEAAADSLVKLLTLVGHIVKPAYSGQDGIEVFRKFRPDSVIVDIGMPGMDGYATIGELRNRGGNEFKAIALSGYGRAEDKEKAFTAGFDHHLTKPVGLTELKEVLA